MSIDRFITINVYGGSADLVEDDFGDVVLFTDHAAAIAVKDAEIADLSRKIGNLADAYMRSVTDRNRLSEEVKNLNDVLDKAQVLRGEDADKFLEKMEAVDEMARKKSALAELDEAHHR